MAMSCIFQPHTPQINEGHLRSGNSPLSLSVALGLMFALWGGASANAAELASANFKHQAGSFSPASAVGAGALSSFSGSPVYGDAQAVVGAAPLAKPAGSDATLVSMLPGFLAIVVGALPNLDLDGDLAQFFLDEDDDGDGLEDIHETGTGFFVSATNTGSSPTVTDTDGDGFNDGDELAAGSDPTNAASTPGPPPQVPTLTPSIGLLLLLILLFAGLFSIAPLKRIS